MGKSTRHESPAEIPVPDGNPELSPDVPEDPITVPPPKHPIVPEHPDKPEVIPDTEPDVPEKPGTLATIAIRPEV